MDMNLTYSIMYLEINVISVLIVAFIHYKTSGITKMVAQRNFAMAIDSEIIFFLSDLFYVLMMQGLMPFSVFFLLLFKTVYFISTSLMCFFWFIYFEHIQESMLVKNRRRTLCSSALVWVMGIILVVNVFTGVCFKLDENGVYVRGPLFMVLYLISYPYVLITCCRAFYRSFTKKYHAQRKELRKLAFFPVVPAIAGLIQFVQPQLPVACLALSFATLIIYMDWTDQMISADPLTRLHNRKMLEYYYDQWSVNKEAGASLYLLMVDANKFKSINDTFGHVQGDMALIRIADAIRQALSTHSRRFTIARYGGDEFAILVWEEDEQGIAVLKDRIDSELKKLNKEAGAPYDLTVSIGSYKAEQNMPLKALVEKADEQLYEAKKNYASR